MDSRHLSKEQCDWLNGQLSAMAHRLCLIYTRMKEREFPADDRLYQRVYKAYDATLRASHHAHWLSGQGKMDVTYFFVGDDGIGRTEPSSESSRGACDQPPAQSPPASRGF